MASTSSAELATALLQRCLDGLPWPEDALEQLVLRACNDREASRALFGILVERLADLFEPRLCEVYTRLFSQVIELVRPELNAGDLVNRYQRIRRPTPVERDPELVYVLSRVTLGADIAVTSVLMDAAKRRFPRARICFVGPRKNWELFAADPRVELRVHAYSRGGTLAERLAPLELEGGIVLDPDSRLTQLGLLPVCDEPNYYFFESRSYGGDSDESITSLAGKWTQAVLGIRGRPYLAPLPVSGDTDVAVSFGVGENHEKRIQGGFESELLGLLKNRRVLVDEGGSREEAARVREAVSESRIPAEICSGSYASFAYRISQGTLYLGYDSAGQHVAAAAGVPLITIFAGYPSERMFRRWRPSGPGPKRVIQVRDRSPRLVLQSVREALEELCRVRHSDGP